MLPRGLEPRTLRLLAVRSDQLSYKSLHSDYILRTARQFAWVYSSAVERLTADQQVPGSNPGAPCFRMYKYLAGCC